LQSISSLLARVVLVASVVLVSPQLAAEEAADVNCHWWQFGRCDKDQGPEGLPPDAPRTGTLITVDVAANRIYLFQDGQLVDMSTVASGSGKVLKKGMRTWLFHTPRGRMKVLRKIENPIWTKPDWAFVEDREPIPPPDSPKRQIKGHLGRYALDLGDGIMIHGTDDSSSFGKRASHGCIRVPPDMLEKVWKATNVGTEVYIYESLPPKTQQALNDLKLLRQPERHSDLD
jgi:lipoprotein-anchoring transpeptidase ErfK/SrfK